MLQLYLLRHAKSSWGNPGTADHDRPLAPRGQRAAPLIGLAMKNGHFEPGLILCSTAIRARQTLDLVLGAGEFAAETKFDRRIYDADAEDILGLIATTPPQANRLMIVGHNPTMHGLALQLSQKGNNDDLIRLQTKYPTGGLAVIEFVAEDWQAVVSEPGTLKAFFVPRDLD